MMFSANPALIIVAIVNLLDPYTIALGGVATGSMNAQLAAKHTGTVKETGRTPIAIARAPNTGKKVVVVVTLLVISVKKIIKVATANIKSIGGTVLRTSKLLPIHIPSPLELIWAASDKPPPNKINKPHGKSLDLSHCRRSPFLEADGVIKINIAAIIAIPASVKPERKSILLSKVLVTHAKTANPKIIEILFSSFVKEPISTSIVFNSFLASLDAIKCIGKIYFVKIIHAANSIMAAKGTPNIIQSNIEISTPYVSCINALNTILGAVPIKVDIPPIVAAYAMPSNRAVSKLDLSLSVSPGIVSAITPQTAKPIGNNINVVEVFITHILINAATSINPPTSFFPLDPTKIIIFRAILLWSPEFSIPRANIKPPRKRYIFLFAYGTAAFSNDVTPNKGKSASGNKAVIATGTVSVAHQIAIKTATAATSQPTSLNPDGAGENIITKNNAIPILKPFFLYADINLLYGKKKGA